MKIRTFSSFDEYQRHTTEHSTASVESAVQEILANVQKRGDEAVLEYTQAFDHVSLEQLRVPESALDEALGDLDEELWEVLEEASYNIRVFHERQRTESSLSFDPDGTVLGWKVTPIDRVGLYVPGGRAVYPSTVLMNVIPAQVAGVPEIAVVSPPGKDQLPHPLVLGTLAFLGVEEVYAMGGAQSVGALAYGTQSIPAVYKITGPGNAYVAEAKRQVYGKVGIDSFAGPSEIMIVCDQESTPVEYLARDLISQAEHDPEARALLVTTSKKQAEEVSSYLETLIPTLPRKEIIEASFANHSAIVLVTDKQEAFDVVNEVAPEHLEVLTANPLDDVAFIRNAGALFLGPHTPEPVGDYFAGPNHTLPTSGCAKYASPLGVADFVKTSSILKYSPERLKFQSEAIQRFAEEEELYGHAAAVRVRCE